MSLCENERFLEILKPLRGNSIENPSPEYRYHLNLLQEFDLRLRSIEILFDDLYMRTQALEEDFSNLKC